MRPANAEIQTESEMAAVAAFVNAAKRVPAYSEILQAKGIKPEEVSSIESFRKDVPLTDKQSLFASRSLSEVCLDGSLNDVQLIYSSSGFSNVFSFGAETGEQTQVLAKKLDLVLEQHFSVSTRRTLLINALPMSVRIPVTNVVVFEAGLRADAVIAAVRHLGDNFDQIIMAGEQAFLKMTVEEGVEAGVRWDAKPVTIICGGEFVPENFRNYMGMLLGHKEEDPSKGLILITLGVSELGLSLGHETPACQRLRRLAVANSRLSEKLFGQTPFLPALVQWNPHELFIETISSSRGRPEIAVTTLDPCRKIPLIRYATEDWAEILSPEKVADALGEFNSLFRPEDFDMPVLAFWGRGRSLKSESNELFPEQIKEAIYADPATARALTGNFRMKAQGPDFQVYFQLKKNHDASAMIGESLACSIRENSSASVMISLVPYMEFSSGLELSYQRKFRYF